jgi:cytochrome c-type biogenesis protein CcmH
MLLIAISATTATAWAEPEAPNAANFDKFVPGAAELEGRIIAPCCWTQTIDIHGSEISTQLRQEIRARLSHGESADSIEHSLIDRYGPKIMAVPPGSHLGNAGGLIALTLAFAGIGAVVLLRRWQHRSIQPKKSEEKPATAAEAAQKSALDARLDAELAALDNDR